MSWRLCLLPGQWVKKVIGARGEEQAPLVETKSVVFPSLLLVVHEPPQVWVSWTPWKVVDCCGQIVECIA